MGFFGQNRKLGAKLEFRPVRDRMFQPRVAGWRRGFDTTPLSSQYWVNNGSRLTQPGHELQRSNSSKLQRSSSEVRSSSELQRQLQTAPRERANVEHHTSLFRVYSPNGFYCTWEGSDTRLSRKRPRPAKDSKFQNAACRRVAATKRPIDMRSQFAP